MPSFVIDAQPVGFLDAENNFRRGGQQVAIPPTRVEIADGAALSHIYANVPQAKRFTFGTLAQDDAVAVSVDGDSFFSKHIAVVGSTGSGKSCTVAKLLQEGIRPTQGQSSKGVLNNSHIVIFDLHGENRLAFPKANTLAIENLVLPYWLLKSEELEEMFLEVSNEQNHNQRSQFRQAVIENKRRHNPGVARISYDAPLYFSLAQVYNYISNLNAEMISKLPGEDCPKLADGTLVDRREDHYFEAIRTFVPQSAAKESKANSGPLHGDFDKFLMRLEGKLNDDRLAFILQCSKPNGGGEYKSDDLCAIVQQIVGYADKKSSNVTVIDLSGIPFEVLSIVVSLISRLVFDFCFHFKKSGASAPSQSGGSKPQEWPVLMVYEEAHNYIPNSQSSAYSTVKKSIERIAKEGRKYGISLMIVSQRPSEISETIFSQCNNFVAMRLTNPSDQNYVQRLLPDSVAAITQSLPTLEKREALVIGEAIALPTIVRIHHVDDRPDSSDIDFHTEWKNDWLELQFAKVITNFHQ